MALLGRGSTKLLASLTLAGSAFLGAGCASSMRNVPIRPLTRQTDGTMTRDSAQCIVWTEAHPPDFPYAAELGYAACMIARHYQVYVQVGDGYQEYITMPDVRVEVRQASPRTHFSRTKVLKDLVECRRESLATVSIAERVGRTTGVLAGFVFPPAAVGSTTLAVTLIGPRERDYAACMDPRGYAVTRWEPQESVPESREGPER